MAKEEEQIYTCSAQQLFERRKNRDLLTSTLSADIGLGGGIPMGCTVLMGGKQKSGKTSTALAYAACAQRLYGSKIFFANIEGRLDNKVLEQIKDLDRTKVEVIMGPAILDKKGEVVGNKKMSSQQWWKVIGDLITNNPRSVIIVDSVSALSEAAELAEGMGHMSRGGLQKLESQFVRQYGDLIVPNGITLFLLAQVQANTSGYGEALQIKCGNALRFMADAIIFIKHVEKWKENAAGRILGHDIVWKIEASPLGPPFVETKVPLRFGEGLDKAYDIFNNALNWGLIKKTGAWYLMPFKKVKDKIAYNEITEEEEGKGENVKIQGEENCRTWLVENQESMKFLDEKIRKTIFIS